MLGFHPRVLSSRGYGFLPGFMKSIVQISCTTYHRSQRYPKLCPTLDSMLEYNERIQDKDLTDFQPG